MQSISGITDIDRLIISHANPPAVLTMSELNTYYYSLTVDRASEFRCAKYDIESALKSRSDWIIQWHIECVDQHTKGLSNRFGFDNGDRDYYMRIERRMRDIGWKYNNISLVEHGVCSFIEANRVLQESLIRSSFNKKYFDPIFFEYISRTFTKEIGSWIDEYTISKVCLTGKFLQAECVFKYMLKGNIEELASLLQNIIKKWRWSNRYSLHNCIVFLIDFCERHFLSVKLDFDMCVLKFAAEKSDVKYIRKIITYAKRTQSSIGDITQLFRDICVKGYIGSAQVIYDSYADELHTYLDHHVLFVDICAKGEADIIQWFWKVWHPKLDIHINSEQIFRTGCGRKNGLQLIRWLVELGEQLHSPIDIHATADKAFQNAYDRGYVHILDYLFELADRTYGSYSATQRMQWIRLKSLYYY